VAPGHPRAPAPRDALPPIGFGIQAGAFRDSDNAVRLSEELRGRGLEACHGKIVRIDELSEVYYERPILAARAYLQ
jgi:cell division septation protein DedD